MLLAAGAAMHAAASAGIDLLDVPFRSLEDVVVVDGELIELPVVRSMYRVLAIAERTNRAA
jgi:hypothetical protein